MAERVKNLPAMWETWVRSLGWEDPLEKGMAAHPSILAWGIHARRRLGGRITVPGVAESDKEQLRRWKTIPLQLKIHKITFLSTEFKLEAKF